MSSRPVLAPGIAVYRRPEQRLQIGLNPGIVVPDAPGLEKALRLIDGVTPQATLERAMREVTAVDPRELFEALRAAGVVIDASSQTLTTPRTTIRLRCEGPVERFAARLGGLLTDSGLTITDTDPAHHVVLVSDGEPARGPLERLRLDQIPHTTVSVLEGHVRWGPTIVDTTDPCWGCVDARFADHDQAWPALTTQFGRRTTTPAHQSVTPAHLQVALGHIAHDLTATVTSRSRPLTGRLAILRADLTLSHVATPNHPDCDCNLLPISPLHLS